LLDFNAHRQFPCFAPILWCKAHLEIWVYALWRDVLQQQQRVGNVLAVKFMIGIKYRKVLGVCQGGITLRSNFFAFILLRIWLLFEGLELGCPHGSAVVPVRNIVAKVFYIYRR
jgi:hypothetical protein